MSRLLPLAMTAVISGCDCSYRRSVFLLNSQIYEVIYVLLKTGMLVEKTCLFSVSRVYETPGFQNNHSDFNCILTDKEHKTT